MNHQNIDLLDDLSGQALNEYVSMKIKHFCFEQAGHDINEQFDECFKRTSFLNFSYFNQLLNQNNQAPRTPNEAISDPSYGLAPQR